MNIITDVAFSIGATHDVCEDYARASEKVVVLCDGCSSSEDTDIGARFLALSAIDIIDRCHSFADVCIPYATATHAYRHYPVTGDMLDATLLYASYGTEVSSDGETLIFTPTIRVGAAGDGIIVIERTNGTREVLRFDYPSGAPYYANYDTDVERLSRFEAHFGTECIVRDMADASREPAILDHAHYEVTLDPQTVSRITLLSDGALSFQAKDGSKVDHLEVVNTLTAFKSANGPFVKRRLKMALKDLERKRGWVNQDDISVACLVVNP